MQATRTPLEATRAKVCRSSVPVKRHGTLLGSSWLHFCGVHLFMLAVWSVSTGPSNWMAPEALSQDGGKGCVVSAATDMYMLGGLLFEILTGGDVPFYWMPGGCDTVCLAFTVAIRCSTQGFVCSVSSLAASVALDRRRHPAGLSYRVPSGDGLSESPTRRLGLHGLSTVVAAALDGVPLQWAVRTDSTAGTAGRLDDLVAIMAACLSCSPGDRPTSAELQEQLQALLFKERAEQRGLLGVASDEPSYH